MKRQIGATLSGLMFFLALLVMLAYVGVRIAPTWFEYWAVDRVLEGMVVLPSMQNGDDESIRSQFEKEIKLNNVTQVGRRDLLIEHLPGGKLRLSVPLSAKKPLVGPVSLALDFLAEASSGQ